MLWPDLFVSETNLASLVAEIRRALDDDAQPPPVCQDRHRFGYAFCGEAAKNQREWSSRIQVRSAGC